MQQNLSVIICTHNPRLDYLERVLQALNAQTLSKHDWELLLIDNASDRLLSKEIDLSWHPNARHIREDQLGLTPARLRGIKEATADLLVFVDDDNILNPDYLENTLKVGGEYNFIGAWGGQIVPEFETPPPDWTKPYWGVLAIREFNKDKWSNLLHQHETTPCGAGLCVRGVVATKYVELVNTHPQRLAMDRKGKLLTSCGDSDLAFTACDIGLGTGQFSCLKLTHLIPSKRLTQDYLLKLVEGMSYSSTLLGWFRGVLPSRTSWIKNVFLQYQRWKMAPIHRAFFDASQRGIDLALQTISESHLPIK